MTGPACDAGDVAEQIRPVMAAMVRRLGCAVLRAVHRVAAFVRAAMRPADAVVGVLRDLPRSRRELVAENLLLRQAPFPRGRPRLTRRLTRRGSRGYLGSPSGCPDARSKERPRNLQMLLAKAHSIPSSSEALPPFGFVRWAALRPGKPAGWEGGRLSRNPGTKTSLFLPSVPPMRCSRTCRHLSRPFALRTSPVFIFRSSKELGDRIRCVQRLVRAWRGRRLCGLSCRRATGCRGAAPHPDAMLSAMLSVLLSFRVDRG